MNANATPAYTADSFASLAATEGEPTETTLANLVVAGNNLIKKQPHKLSCC